METATKFKLVLSGDKFQSRTLLTQLALEVGANVRRCGSPPRLYTRRSLFSPEYIVHPKISWRLLLMQRTDCARILERLKAGRRRPARIAMIAITTISSISVKAERNSARTFRVDFRATWGRRWKIICNAYYKTGCR